jgi:hypothetical protein
MDTTRIADPCGLVTADDERAVAPAARPTALEGLRLAALDNGKPNAGHALSRMVASLAGHARVVAGPARGKAMASPPCPDALLDELGDLDAALVGVGA